MLVCLYDLIYQGWTRLDKAYSRILWNLPVFPIKAKTVQLHILRRIHVSENMRAMDRVTEEFVGLGSSDSGFVLPFHHSNSDADRRGKVIRECKQRFRGGFETPRLSRSELAGLRSGVSGPS